jgi:hypothetical protein
MRYGKVRGHHCWWLTINGRSAASFDDEKDINKIINLEKERDILEIEYKKSMKFVNDLVRQKIL